MAMKFQESIIALLKIFSFKTRTLAVDVKKRRNDVIISYQSPSSIQRVRFYNLFQNVKNAKNWVRSTLYR